MDIEFTNEQLAVIGHKIPGHARVLAGPGTGKSTTAVALLEKLLEDKAGAVKLKFLTFTRATTIELASKLSNSKAAPVKPSTIHSFAINILLQNVGAASIPLPLRIPDDYETSELIQPQIASIINPSYTSTRTV